MKKLLKKQVNQLYYFKNRVKVYGVHERISGNVTGIYGNVSYISGNLDDCEITPEERKAGVHISTLVE